MAYYFHELVESLIEDIVLMSSRRVREIKKHQYNSRR